MVRTTHIQPPLSRWPTHGAHLAWDSSRPGRV